ncbi:MULTISPECIES: pyrroline-5-carboxylate reductase [Rhodococcus]|uniref:pyrroline-5-carboxylate reductase n=1 Tax=Rhodococcus TaxID=1827 RepID=UPI000588082F|nr:MULTISPECIES: pyrroline-5-carboxylate reductase [Rhodococcus]MCD2142452.1 pyrroline-5-carboxylate reductase [Rhodococcus pyridinivorans]MCW3470965.1 pyrroline-5-carboxylate reductase [Rhodococcus pyridinivorans]OBA32001.1 pyrroline-5-carboxylate reductase [Rhodococcus sp. 852002-51564_SCH6189132-a]QQM52274.1 pyrroline-5-carboxylate reductase [Rhodococcus pyridinivorans]QXU52751.1 pyrroline-5-carboxylate reductase [Rhodococcus sp. LW-XY12]
MTRIAVIGGGRIGEALISGLLKNGFATKDLVVAEKFEERREELSRAYSIRVTDSTSDAAEGADVVVVAVKPNDVDVVVTALAAVDAGNDDEQILVSLAAGIPTVRYETKLPAGFPVVRVMPNTPILVGEGASVLSAGRYVKQQHLDTVREILASVGTVSVVPEAQIDAVTAVSGSGPAYFFLVAEAMIDAGVSLGLTRAVATDLVVQTMTGSAAMLTRSGDNAADLRAAVTSPGGTTAAAIRELERGGLRTAFYEALDAAKRRSAQLGAASDQPSPAAREGLSGTA